MKVTLYEDELAIASMIGCRRHIKSIGWRDRFPDRENIAWAIDVEGACAELACCKVLGWYWQALSGGEKAPGDIGKGVQVRSTRHETGGLIIRESDRDNDGYLLVTCRAPNYVIRGWMRGGDCKKDEYRQTNDRDPKPFWLVPQNRLREFQITAK
jgi:hypothetical protein